MLGKLLFRLVGFITAWAGLILTFKGYAVPGVMIGGFGYVLFKVTCPFEEGEI